MAFKNARANTGNVDRKQTNESVASISSTETNSAKRIRRPFTWRSLAICCYDIQAEIAADEVRLFMAACDGDVPIINQVLSRGLYIDCKSKTMNHWTPLLIAANAGRVLAVSVLLDAGASIDVIDNDGNTALHLATLEKHAEVVDLLLRRGANPNCKNKDSITPLLYAAATSNLANINHLLAKCANTEDATRSPEIGEKIGLYNGHETSLALACKQGDLGIAKALVANGAGVDPRAWDNSTPLITACIDGHVVTAKYLISAGANLNAMNKTGVTPLIAACENNHPSVVSALIHGKAQLEAVNTEGSTALLVAAQYADVAVIVSLINAKCNIEARNKDGSTALLIACAFGNFGSAEKLIAAGAEVNITDKLGRRPLELVNNPKIKKNLEEMAGKQEMKSFTLQQETARKLTYLGDGSVYTINAQSPAKRSGSASPVGSISSAAASSSYQLVPTANYESNEADLSYDNMYGDSQIVAMSSPIPGLSGLGSVVGGLFSYIPAVGDVIGGFNAGSSSEQQYPKDMNDSKQPVENQEPSGISTFVNFVSFGLIGSHPSEPRYAYEHASSHQLRKFAVPSTNARSERQQYASESIGQI